MRLRAALSVMLSSTVLLVASACSDPTESASAGADAAQDPSNGTDDAGAAADAIVPDGDAGSALGPDGSALGIDGAPIPPASTDYKPGSMVQAILDLAAEGKTARDTAGRFIAKVQGGPYLLTAPLMIAGNVHLDVSGVRLVAHFPTTGTGTGVTASGVKGTMLLNVVTDGTAAYAGAGNIAVTGGTWEPTWEYFRLNEVPPPMNVLTFIHTQDVLVEKVTIHDVKWWHAVELNAVSGASVVSSVFEGWIVDPTVGLWHGEAVQLDMPLAGNTWGGLPDATPTKEVRVANNGCDKSGTQGGWGKLCGSHTQADGKIHSDVVIEGNTVRHAVWDGIGPINTQRVVIRNNIVADCYGGIYVKGVAPNNLTGVDITGNTVTGTTTRAALGVFGDPTGTVQDVLVKGNTVTPCRTTYANATFREPAQVCP